MKEGQEKKVAIDADPSVSVPTAYPRDSKKVRELRTTIGLIAGLLEYPSENMLDRAISEESLEAIVPHAEIRQGILLFLADAKKESVSRLRAKYVTLFDFSERTTFNLTYHIFGEERDRAQKTQRGTALLLLKSLYSEAGFQPKNSELPDYLPMALEFVAIAPMENGVKVARLIVEPTEVLERNLRAEAPEYAGLLNVCVAALKEFDLVAKSATEGNGQGSG